MSDINWEEMINEAAKKTDKEYASEFSSLTRLTDDEMKDFIITPDDKKKFAHLISVVKDKTKSNNEKAEAISNINGSLNIIAPLLEKLI